jgi:hypothetical protein
MFSGQPMTIPAIAAGCGSGFLPRIGLCSKLQPLLWNPQVEHNEVV